MAQDGTTAGGASYQIDNVTFPVARTKLQSILDAIRSTNIGNTAPDLVTGQFWIDNNTPSTTVWTMYFYDGTDSIQFATIDTINNTVNFIDSTFDLINDETPELGGDLSLNSNDIIGTGNIDITGNVSLTGTVDGRDIATDGTKLDGIEASATANPNAIDNVVEDLTPELGGNLDLNSNTINGTGTINMTGNVTATSFFGDGSNLTGIGDASGLTDADGDTKIQSEESADEDKLRFDTAGVERAVMDSNGLFFTTNGGFVAHHNDIANDMTLTNQNMMLVGSVTVSGTLTIGTGSTVVII
jgi:hypothetical protein